MIFIYFLIQLISSITYGIDLGTDTIKIARCKGKVFKSEIEKNKYNHDSTPNVFAYQDKTKQSFGEDAIGQCRIHPETCIQNERLPLTDELLFPNFPLKGYQIVSLILKQLTQQVHKHKIVIAVPPTFSGREKSYLYSALKIADIHCVRFITTTYAPIETFIREQLDWSFDVTAAFIDIGHSGIRISGFTYGNSKITQNFGYYNENLGGKSIDEKLFQIIAKRNNLQDIVTTQKDRFILLAKIKRAREQLSKLNNTIIEFKTINISITRDDIDYSCNEIKESLSLMIQSALKNNPDVLKKQSKVYLIGGCSQIPCLQNHIKELLPDNFIDTSMDPFSSVSKGASYILRSHYKHHNSLITNDYILVTDNNEFNLFTHEDHEDSVSTYQINNIDPKQVFHIYDKRDNNQEFIRFTIQKNLKGSKINLLDDIQDIINSAIEILADQFITPNEKELHFSMTYYLTPLPQISNRFRIKYETIGWEITKEIKERSKKAIKSMIKDQNQKLIVNENCKKIDDFKEFVKIKLKKFIITNWRRLSFPVISSHYDSKYNECLQQNDYDCPERKIDEILQNFKSKVSSFLKIDVSDYDKIQKGQIPNNNNNNKIKDENL